MDKLTKVLSSAKKISIVGYPFAQIYENYNRSKIDIMGKWIEACGMFPHLIEVSKVTYRLIYCLHRAKGNMASGNILDFKLPIGYSSGLENDEVVVWDGFDMVSLLYGGEIIEDE